MDKDQIMKHAVVKALNNGMNKDYLNEYPLQELIFQIDFAKAFWGEEEFFTGLNRLGDGYKDGNYYDGFVEDICVPKWLFHMQEMIAQEDRVLYLEKFL